MKLSLRFSAGPCVDQFPEFACGNEYNFCMADFDLKSFFTARNIEGKCLNFYKHFDVLHHKRKNLYFILFSNRRQFFYTAAVEMVNKFVSGLLVKLASSGRSIYAIRLSPKTLYEASISLRFKL